MKKCPFKFIAYELMVMNCIKENVDISIDYEDCLEKHCALYNESIGECSFYIQGRVR